MSSVHCQLWMGNVSNKKLEENTYFYKKKCDIVLIK